MRALDILCSRWCISFIGAALLAGLAWFFAPLLPGFEDWPPRVALIAALLLAWGGGNALLDLRRLQRDAALAKGIAADVTEQTEEAQALRTRLTDRARPAEANRCAAAAICTNSPGTPIIGPPGAGKTTALLNAGLRFPLAEQMGQGAIAGVGGTRLCDWWFTEDAVLIDTAGRYTTQDSNAAVDRAGWEAFLDLLKETRPRQPLNGLIVAFPLSDIALAPAAERKAHAAAIRSRIKELQTRFGIRMPVYVLFTKADLIAGFTEFFDDLDREKRAQVWGTTFELTPTRRGPVAAFAAELRALVERLNARLFDRLQAERNADRRALIAMFPGQIASLEPALLEFLHDRVRRSPRRSGAAAARDLLHLGHAGGHADRSADRHSGAGPGCRSGAGAEPAAGAGAQLLPRAPAEGGDLRRGIAGRAQPRRHPTPQVLRIGRLRRRRLAGRWRRQCCGRCAAPASARSMHRRQRSPATNRPRAAAAGSGRRRRPGTTGATARSGACLAARR